MFSVRFGWNQVKICKKSSTFFTIVLQIFPFVFFSRARSTAGEGGTEKYRSWYLPPYQPSKWLLGRRAAQPYLCPLFCFGLYGRAKILVQVSRAIPVQVYDKKFKRGRRRITRHIGPALRIPLLYYAYWPVTAYLPGANTECQADMPW